MPNVRTSPPDPSPTSRREFLAISSTAMIAAGALPAAGGAVAGAEIRIGLIGCGGRGTGAAVQAAAADPGVRIVSLGDMFADQLASAAHVLARDAAGQFTCPAKDRFCGVDAYRRVLDAGVDAVLIAAPPNLRPLHVEAAVAAGVHVFCETPAAIDLPGTVRVARALFQARAAGRTIGSGLHSRRDPYVASVVHEVRTGVIGRPWRVHLHAVPDLPWRLPSQAGWTPAEMRLRNWVSHECLSGGHFVERHLHAIDRGLWVLGDRAPDLAEPLPTRGDGVAVRFRFADGAEILATCMLGARAERPAREVVDASLGTRQLSLPADGRRFQATMDAFLRSIRSGSGVPGVSGMLGMDDSDILIRGSLVAIMGRLSAASSRPVSWEEMLAANGVTFPVCQTGRGVNLAGV